MFLQAKKLQITTHKINSQRQKIWKKTNLVHLEPPFNNFGLVIPRHIGADSCVVLLVIIVCGWKPKFDTWGSRAFGHINASNIRIGDIQLVVAVFKLHIVCTVLVAERVQNQVLGIHSENELDEALANKLSDLKSHRDDLLIGPMFYLTLNFTFSWFWPR